LFNRRYLDEILPRLLAHMLALNGTVAVMMVDADHFKRINDNHGHPAVMPYWRRWAPSCVTASAVVTWYVAMVAKSFAS
jgi:hypothetical protein